MIFGFPMQYAFIQNIGLIMSGPARTGQSRHALRTSVAISGTSRAQLSLLYYIP